ncbi:ribonuclease H-like domain-containing protein [Tanacetum coccineum]
MHQRFLRALVCITVIHARLPLIQSLSWGADGLLVSVLTLYGSLAGALQYLTFTRPNLSYAVHQVCLYMYDPREPHLASLKRSQMYMGRAADLLRRFNFSVNAKYCGVANAVAEMFWLRNLLRELHSPLHSATIVYCDNDQVAKGQVHILHVPSRYQYANIFTKGLPSSLFEELHTSLSVLHPLALTRGLVEYVFYLTT